MGACDGGLFTPAGMVSGTLFGVKGLRKGVFACVCVACGEARGRERGACSWGPRTGVRGMWFRGAACLLAFHSTRSEGQKEEMFA